MAIITGSPAYQVICRLSSQHGIVVPLRIPLDDWACGDYHGVKIVVTGLVFPCLLRGMCPRLLCSLYGLLTACVRCHMGELLPRPVSLGLWYDLFIIVPL